MSAFVKLRPTSRLTYVNFKPAEGVSFTVNPTHYSASIDIQESDMSKGLSLGTIHPKTYAVMVVYDQDTVALNPGIPSIVIAEPGDKVELKIPPKVGKKLSGRIAKVYLID